MSRAGAYYLILVGLMLCLAGVVFAALMWRSFDRALDQRKWAEVPCRILESQVMERKKGPDIPVEYGFGVLYGYDFAGKAWTARDHSLRGIAWSHAPERAEALRKKFPVGSGQVCYVDPDDPARAVLKRDSKAPGYSLWFPLLFVVGGLGIIIGAIRGMKRARASA